jgi:threonine/homoserine/homoserine lactone efflux protein
MLRWQPVVFFLSRWQAVTLHSILNVIVVLLLIMVSASPNACIVVGTAVGSGVDFRQSGVCMDGGIICGVCVGVTIVKLFFK